MRTDGRVDVIKLIIALRNFNKPPKKTIIYTKFYYVRDVKYIYFFGSMPSHVLVDFVVLPSGHGSSVTDF